MTTSTHTADTPDTVEAIVSRAILTGQLLPSMRAWALHLGNKDRAALLSFLAEVSGDPVATPTADTEHPDATSASATGTTTPTPGPWCFDDRYGVIAHAAGDPVATVCFNAADSLAQEAANGHLIAAAPELLRVVRLALADLDGLRATLAQAIAMARLLALLAEGVAFDPAVWSVTDRGREMDTARLADLFDGHRRAGAAPGAPVATPATSASTTPGPWRYVWPCVIANAAGDSVEVALCRSAAVGSVEVADANGRLIAAAPELLAALRDLLADAMTEGMDRCPSVLRARAALEAAGGAA